MCGCFKGQNIYDQTEIINQIIVANMLQNWNHRYSNQYKIIKCVGFELIHYTINLDAASSSKVFSEFDFFFFYQMYC